MYREIGFEEIKDLKVGHYTDLENKTGCTVILPQKKCIASVDVRGGGPASRETDLLNPLSTIDEIHGLVLTGGSAYGLSTADGVLRYLEERNIGFSVGNGVVPLVPASAVFDLHIGDFKIRPNTESGYIACKNATINPRFGKIGAGTGCTVGKLCGIEKSMAGGIGSFVLKCDELYIGAIVVVNALGDIYENNKIIAGAKDNDEFINCDEYIRHHYKGYNLFDSNNSSNTTIGAIFTNGKLNKTQLKKIASFGHQGMNIAIRPVHTMYDGDTLYALSLGDVEVDFNSLGSYARLVVERAIINAVK